MKATCLGWTVEGTPYEIWQLIKLLDDDAKSKPFKEPIASYLNVARAAQSNEERKPSRSSKELPYHGNF